MPTFVTPSGVELAWEEFPGEGPTIVLIMGLGAQMVWWPDGFCRHMSARGFRVIRFDNRDVGLSSCLSILKPPSLWDIARGALLGHRIHAPYDLEDMAEDVVHLLDHLQVPRAHIVGTSMGGMIAQLVALNHPARVWSLTSMMSHTGDVRISRPSLRTMLALIRPLGATRKAVIQNTTRVAEVLGTTAPVDLDWTRRTAARSYDRCAPDSAAIFRQMGAVYASVDRTARLKHMRIPTLVIHGGRDTAVPVAAGQATARVIPLAKFMVFRDMGHELPRRYWARILRSITQHAASAMIAERDRRAARRVGGLPLRPRVN